MPFSKFKLKLKIIVFLSIIPFHSMANNYCKDYYGHLLTDLECHEMKEIKNNYQDYTKEEKQLATVRIEEIKDKLLTQSEKVKKINHQIKTNSFNDMPMSMLIDITDLRKQYLDLSENIKMEISLDIFSSDKNQLSEEALEYIQKRLEFIAAYKP